MRCGYVRHVLSTLRSERRLTPEGFCRKTTKATLESARKCELTEFQLLEHDLSDRDLIAAWIQPSIPKEISRR